MNYKGMCRIEDVTAQKKVKKIVIFDLKKLKIVNLFVRWG